MKWHLSDYWTKFWFHVISFLSSDITSKPFLKQYTYLLYLNEWNFTLYLVFEWFLILMFKACSYICTVGSVLIDFALPCLFLWVAIFTPLRFSFFFIFSRIGFHLQLSHQKGGIRDIFSETEHPGVFCEISTYPRLAIKLLGHTLFYLELFRGGVF